MCCYSHCACAHLNDFCESSVFMYKIVRVSSKISPMILLVACHNVNSTFYFTVSVCKMNSLFSLA